MVSRAGIDIYANDHASGTIRSVQGGLRGLAGTAKGSILTGVGLGAGVLAFGAVTLAAREAIDFLSDAIVAAKEEEASIAKLDAALRANAKGWDGNTQALEDRLDAGKDLAFSDDEQRESLALLVAATGDVDKAFAIMATAMDLARLKNTDLVTASEALIKVDSGRFRMLANLGIELEEGATATEALAAVQAIAAGQAVAYSDTSQGALDELQVKFDDLKEEIGEKFLPILVKLADWVNDELIPAIDGFISMVESIDWDKVGNDVQGFIDDLQPLADILNFIVGAGEKINHFFTSGGGVGGSSGFGPPAGGSGGGSRSPIPNNLAPKIILDGRELQASSVRWDYYSAGGNSRLPR